MEPGDARRVVSSDGLLVLDIPAGALPQGVDIRMTDVTDEVELMAVGRAYRIEPSGTVFSEPARLSLTLPFDPTEAWVDLGGADLVLARLEDGRWQELETTWDAASITLSAEVDRLSQFGPTTAAPTIAYRVGDKHPWWLWADRWQGHVWSQFEEEEGVVTPFQPHLRSMSIAYFGEHRPSWPLVAMPVIFEGREPDAGTGTVRWGASPGVVGRFRLMSSTQPVDEIPCEEGAVAHAIVNTVGDREGFADFPVGNDRYVELTMQSVPDAARYGFEAWPASDTHVPSRTEVMCVMGDELFPYGSFPSTTAVEWGAGTPEAGVPFPGLHELLTGVDVRPTAPPVTTDMARWTFAPEHDWAMWRAEYMAHLQSGPYGLRVSYWEYLLTECEAGRTSGIFCRAARRALNNHEEVLAAWEADCARLQGLLLDAEVAPILEHTVVFDDAVVAGPTAFCIRVHRLLFSFIPHMPAGSHAVFRSRLTYEMRRLYPLSALQALF